MCVCVCGVCAFRPVFRSYQPQADELKELQMPKAKPVEGRYSVVWFYTVARKEMWQFVFECKFVES